MKHHAAAGPASRSIAHISLHAEPAPACAVWLTNVETCMRSALHKAVKVGIADVAACSSADSLAMWAAENLGQVSILSIALHWTSQTEAALRGAAGLPPTPQTYTHGASAEAFGGTGGYGSTAAGRALRQSRSSGVGVTLAGVLEDHEALVAALAAVLGPHAPAGTVVEAALRRQVLEALLLTALHLRDVLRRLLAAGTSGVDDFAWQAQLRFVSPFFFFPTSPLLVCSGMDVFRAGVCHPR